MIKPDEKVVQAISGMKGELWETILEWFNKSYAELATKHAIDLESDDRKYRIQQGRVAELYLINKYLKEAEQSLDAARKREDQRGKRPIQLETI